MKAISRHTHGRSVGAAVMSGVALLLVVGSFHPAAAGMVVPSADQDIVVRLGVHQFGNLREPDAIVATAAPGEVGFYEPPNGEGTPYGPESFELAQDGSIWLLDSVNSRLQVWEPGQLTNPTAVPLPLGIADFALGHDGTIYATYPDPDSPDKTLGLCALTQAGEVLWTAPTNIEIFNAELSTGPDRAVYVFGGDETQSWTRLTTPEGEPLTVDEQRQETRPSQPLPGGGGLSATYVSDYEQRFTQTDEAGKVVHAWRVTSETALAFNFIKPRLVDGDLVVAPDVWEQTKSEFLFEYLVLRLSPTGEIQQQFSLDHRTVWGDDLFAHVRGGPEGELYQLSTDPSTGASISILSLDADPAPTPSPSPASAKVEPAPPAATMGAPAQQATLRDAPQPPTAISPVASPAASPAGSKQTGGANVIALAPLGGGLIALSGWYWYMRRRRKGTGVPASLAPDADSLSSFDWSGDDGDEEPSVRETVLVGAVEPSPESPEDSTTS